MVLLCSCSIIYLFQILKYFFLVLFSQLMNISSAETLLFISFTWRDDFFVSVVMDMIPYWSVLYLSVLFCSPSLSKHGKWSGVIVKSYTSKQELENTMRSMIILKTKVCNKWFPIIRSAEQLKIRKKFNFASGKSKVSCLISSQGT